MLDVLGWFDVVAWRDLLRVVRVCRQFVTLECRPWHVVGDSVKVVVAWNQSRQRQRTQLGSQSTHSWLHEDGSYCLRRSEQLSVQIPLTPFTRYNRFDNQFDNRLYHVNRAFQFLSMICDCLLLRDVARCPRYVNSSIGTTCFAVFIPCVSQCQIRWKRHSVAAFVLETVMRGFECVIYTMSQNNVPALAYYNFDTR